MIDEKYLLSAVSIRRKYLELMGNLDKYHDKAKATLNSLEEAYKKVGDLQKKINENKSEDFSSLEEFLKILDDIEQEGKKLETLTDPINKDIEKLAQDEAQLYKSICDKYPNMTEDEIVKIVSERLEKEKLI